jgi:3-hydroxyisobutyrate dehydrogenase-like beta-hydroxyacid dehydrogenase
MTTIAFIGVGSMGGQMVRHLLNAGYALRLFARRPEAMQPFVALGAVGCASPAEAAREADFICTNVTATADVEAVLLGSHGAAGSARRGATVCDFSTIDVDATRRLAASLATAGIEFLDCPVSGGVQAAKAAALTIFVGGEERVYAKARPLLERLGKHLFHMGGVGCGQVTKACNQIAQVIAIQGIAEAMHFARANGVDGVKVVEALMSGFAASRMLGLMGPKMAARDFAAGIEARLHHKDLGLVADMARARQLDLPAVRLVRAQLDLLMRAGWGKMDTCNLLRVLESTTPSTQRDTP